MVRNVYALVKHSILLGKACWEDSMCTGKLSTTHCWCRTKPGGRLSKCRMQARVVFASVWRVTLTRPVPPVVYTARHGCCLASTNDSSTVDELLARRCYCSHDALFFRTAFAHTPRGCLIPALHSTTGPHSV